MYAGPPYEDIHSMRNEDTCGKSSGKMGSIQSARPWGGVGAEQFEKKFNFFTTIFVKRFKIRLETFVVG